MLYQVCPRERGTIFTKTLPIVHNHVYLLWFKENHHLPRHIWKATMTWKEGNVKAHTILFLKRKKYPNFARGMMPAFSGGVDNFLLSPISGKISTDVSGNTKTCS